MPTGRPAPLDLKAEFKFSYDPSVTTLCPPYLGRGFPRAESRRMTRCECASQSFTEVARLLRCGLSAEQACERTGCGRTCGACLPDLQHSLEALPND